MPDDLAAPCAGTSLDGCTAPAGSPCVYTTGPNTGKPRAARYGAHQVRRYGSAQWAAGVASRQPEVDTLTARVTYQATRLLEADADIAALTAKVAELTTRPPVVVRETGRPVPADAIWVDPEGDDTAPGTETRPRRTPVKNRDTAFTRDYPGFFWQAPNGTRQSFYAPPGRTIRLVGQGRKKALIAGGVVNLYGDGRISGYDPGYSPDTNAVALYYGGTAAGSEIDGWTIHDCPQAAVGFQVPMVFTRLTVQDMGYSGLLGTTADGTTFGDVTVARLNRAGRGQDGQLGAIKVTRSRGVHFTAGVHVTDTGGAVGLWADVSCRDVIATGATVKTAGGKPASVAFLLEQAQGAILNRVDLEGTFGLSVRASGNVRAYASHIAGSTAAVQLWQDRPKNQGNDPRNLNPDEVPWWTIGVDIADNDLVGPVALTAYAQSTKTPAVTGAITGADMLTGFRRNRYTGTVKLGDKTGKQVTVTDLKAALGTKYAA